MAICREFADRAREHDPDPDFRDHAINSARSIEHNIRDRLLDRCPPIVASLDGVPTSVIAWACFEPDIIHFVFTRERWQRQGLATALLEPFADKPTVMYTHQTPCLRFMPLPRGWIYNPYEVERGEP